MSTIAYKWHPTPPPEPDVYTTRRGNTKYLTLRYFDGQRWYSIDWGGNRGGAKADAFKWPKKSRSKMPAHLKTYANTMRLRKIGVDQQRIQWGEPYKVYDDKEVLAYLVKTGRIAADWRTAYQDEMRHHDQLKRFEK